MDRVSGMRFATGQWRPFRNKALIQSSDRDRFPQYRKFALVFPNFYTLADYATCCMAFFILPN